MSTPAPGWYEPQPNSWTHPPSFNRSTANHILGGAAIGVGVRCWQLGILRQPILSQPRYHVLSAVSFAIIGYWAWRWDVRSTEMIEQKKAELATRQGRIRGL